MLQRRKVAGAVLASAPAALAKAFVSHLADASASPRWDDLAISPPGAAA
jgi:hypothetical protein